jgi:hypothetical protein
MSAPTIPAQDEITMSISASPISDEARLTALLSKLPEAVATVVRQNLSGGIVQVFNPAWRACYYSVANGKTLITIAVCGISFAQSKAIGEAYEALREFNNETIEDAVSRALGDVGAFVPAMRQ